MGRRFIASFVLLACAACSSAPPLAPTVVSEPQPLQIPIRAVQAADDYRLGSPDLLEIKIFELEKTGTITELQLEVPVEGTILIPYAGPVMAKGKTLSELKRAIEVALSKIILSPQLTVTVKDYRSREVAVMGAVEKPGVYHLDRNRVTLLDALSLAGGLTAKDKVAGTKVLVFAPRVAPALSDQQVAVAQKPCTEVDLVALLDRGETQEDFWIEPGSVVQVPFAQEFFVQGYVNKGGAFPYRKPTSVIEAIATAGGFDERKASRSQVRIKRAAQGGTQVIEVDAEAIASGEAPDVPIYPGDTVEAGRTVPWAMYSEFVDGIKGLVGFGVSAGSIR